MNIIDKKLSFGSMNMTNNPNTAIVHHLEAEGINWTVETIHNMHKNENGWAGIGYHYYIRLDGSIYKGRPDKAIGSHCLGANTNTIGVAFEGNYDTRTAMPDAQFKAWCELKSYLVNLYGIIPVFGHREKGSSECPGKNFPLDKIKNASSALTKGYIVTDYLPNGSNGDNSFNGVDANYVLQYFKGINCYFRGNDKGVWIETQYLDIDKCNELKNTLGSWFYEIKLT